MFLTATLKAELREDCRAEKPGGNRAPQATFPAGGGAGGQLTDPLCPPPHGSCRTSRDCFLHPFVQDGFSFRSFPVFHFFPGSFI